MNRPVTLELPDEVWERFRRGARAAGKPLEDFLAERLLDTIPPFSETMPDDLREELSLMEGLDNAALEKIAKRRLPVGQQREYDRLAAKQADGTIVSEDRQALHALGEDARRLTLLKAHASMLLKWRGQPHPSLEQIQSSE